MSNRYYNFCLEAYRAEYDKSIEEFKSRLSGKITAEKLDELDREAQKTAIRIAFTEALSHYPNEPVAELWKAIYRAHLFRKSGISDLDTISKVISADQSWKKSSGHAF